MLLKKNKKQALLEEIQGKLLALKSTYRLVKTNSDYGYEVIDGTKRKAYGDNVVLSISMVQQSDPFCCGMDHLGDFEATEESYLSTVQARSLKLLTAKLATLLLLEACGITNTGGESPQKQGEMTLCFTDNSHYPSTLFGEQAVKAGLFTLVKTYKNSNSGNMINFYVSN